MLPTRALKLIHEYSLPITRPDWKTFKRPINIVYFIERVSQYNRRRVFQLVKKNMVVSPFYIAYNHIYYNGVQSYSIVYSEDIKHVLSNKWLNKRNECYKNFVFINYNCVVSC
jgi:hypothetical protein